MVSYAYVSKKTPPRPTWWKNSFFWLGGLLAILGVWGLFSGESVIRDPGQVLEHGLVWFYFGGSVVMLVNGWLTQAQAVQHYDEAFGSVEEAPVVAGE